MTEVIYALDFDGVICDSAVETGISGWRAAATIWDDFDSVDPSEQIIDDFKRVRPIMGTGYESILINRLLNDGESVQSILENFDHQKIGVMDSNQLDIEHLKQVFADVRDHWIQADLSDWIQKNPLFDGVIEKLNTYSEQGIWYIVTTKQERFVKEILKANQVSVDEQRIFGLDRKKTKVEILLQLMEKHTDCSMCFVEDMLSALIKVQNRPELGSVRLMLAEWGYNTREDKHRTQELGIELIGFDRFMQ